MLHAQSLFEGYLSQVREEHCTKEVELPLGLALEEQSAIQIHKPRP